MSILEKSTADDLLEKMRKRHEASKEKEVEEKKRLEEELRQAYLRRTGRKELKP